MKRNKNLIELSRDHHQGLLLGWKIKQGIRRNVAIEELVDYCIHFAWQALLPHFAEEENQVLIHLDKDDEFRKRTIKEHIEIISLIDQISIPGLANSASLLKLADVIETHIRFEERELFPYMEHVLSADQLDEIGKLIADLHQPYVESYPNEFWTQ